jgi:hypothetical protein
VLFSLLLVVVPLASIASRRISIARYGNAYLFEAGKKGMPSPYGYEFASIRTDHRCGMKARVRVVGYLFLIRTATHAPELVGERQAAAGRSVHICCGLMKPNKPLEDVNFDL